MSKLICIDAGHGGKDSGAVGNDLYEKNLTLKIAKKLGEILKQQGLGIIYTREEDKYVALGERCRIANSKAVDLFVSVHINSATNVNANGIETLCYTKSNLAYDIQDELIKKLKLTDRGVKERKDLYVLNSTDMNAVLVELGFISNVNNANLLKQESFLNDCAGSIAKGICKYLNIEFKELEGEVEMQKVKRKYKYKDKTEEFDVINVDDKNYISVRDFAKLVNKNVKYDNTSKITEIID